MSPSSRRWNHLSKVLTRNGPFVHSNFDPNKGVNALKDFKILVVGAGGLGCELLKDLAMMGFVEIHVIDCDTIDLSNLNRQFLFRTKDVGKSKAVVAAEFINKRVSGCHVVPHYCKIEEKDSSFYRDFQIIVCGLDAVEPRRWLNSTIFNLLEPSNDGSDFDGIIPIVDGGTEGFKGNSRVVIPSMSYPCVECTLDFYPPKVTFPLCTLTQRPRLPEHCIEYVKLVRWSRDSPFGEVPLDGDDPTHLQWVYERSLERAKEYGIEGVTYRLTQGVVKNIIPAVASTNAVIAAMCCTEVFKLATCAAPLLNNYFVFNDSDGIYTYTFEAERKADCVICGNLPINLSISRNITLKDLIEYLESNYAFDSPSITIGAEALFMPGLEEQIGHKLALTLQELNINEQKLLVMDRKNTKTFIMQLL